MSRHLQHLLEFEDLLVPVNDPRHQVVEKMVQHLSQRNKDMPEVSEVTWKVHVVESPIMNAFCLPVSDGPSDVHFYFVIISYLVF